MKTNDERYKERYKELMDWMSSYQSAKSDDNDHHVVKIKAYLKQLMEENDLLRTQKVDLQKDKNAWETQAQKTAEQYHKLEAAKKRLESKLKTSVTDIPIKINDAPLEELYNPEECESKYRRRKRANKVDVDWMIEYAQNEAMTINDARAIKDMLMRYYLHECKSSRADIFEILQNIERITYEHEKNHPKQPVVGKAAQVVVSNNGNVKYYNNKTNGKRK